MPAPFQSPAPSVQGHEAGVWKNIHGTWKPLHGDFFRLGLSVEWHEFHTGEDLAWGRSFHPGSLEICLNFSGHGQLAAQALAPEQIAMYGVPGDGMSAVRRAGSLHRFITLELSRDFLKNQFAGMLDRLKPAVRRFLEDDTCACLEFQALPASLLPARLHLPQPPVAAAARDTWYLGRVLEILAQTLFPAEDPSEFFCHRQQRANREKIERARYLIERDLENPPSLELLARELALSPFHLSRVFTQESGVSIPKFLRMKRIEKAAEFLRAGRMNVTTAAMAVGYSSLSAFNKAFLDQMGCCPGLYPNVPLSSALKM